tara:strand:+ start:12823 stop:14631 length:1809 start_codon:yes stop_codon:yes gene_type:complete
MKGWESAAVVETVMKGSREQITLVNRDLRITHVNRLGPGLESSDVIGALASELVPNTPELVTAALTRAFETGKPDSYEFESVGPTGPVQWSSHVLPVFEDGQVTVLAVLSQNITTQRQEETARKSFFTLSKDLLCTAGLDGFFKSVTPAFTNLLGHNESQLLSKPFFEFVHPEDVQHTIDVIEQMGEDGCIDDFENRYRDNQGVYHRIYWSGVYDLNTDRIYAVGRDITEKRRLEEQLLQSQKLDAVGQLAGGLAHDFNNLVLAVMMNAELAMRDTDSSLATECLGEIMTAGERAGAITTQLLSFSKADVFQPVVVDLCEIVRDLWSMIRRLLPGSMEIAVQLPDEPVYACVDRGQIEQVIVNLCINARDAMPETGGKLRLNVESEENSGAILRVIDNGTGIPQALQQRVFEPYFTTKDRGIGTGLGLSSVYTVLSRHRGRIDVQSTLGEGCEMRVWLPQSDAPKAPSLIDLPVKVSGTELSGMKILVAEDDAQVRTVVVHVLEAEGLTVYVAKDGAEAIDLLDDIEIDFALLDLVMPRASGHDVFLALRQRFANVPVVFSTGYTDGHLPDDALSDPRVVLLRKPYRPQALSSALQSMLPKS